MMNKYLSFSLAFLLTSCATYHPIKPNMDYSIDESYLKTLPSPFRQLTREEKTSDWGKENFIGISFAKELDLYRGITALKRSSFLLPKESDKRRQEIDYQILLSYYLGKRYHTLIQTWENSSLLHVTPRFPAYFDLLLMLYDTFSKTEDEEKQAHLLQLIEETKSSIAERLDLSLAIERANLNELEDMSHTSHELKDLLDSYNQKKKSSRKAAYLNALLPGAGYFYLGQKQSGVTAFFLNALFIGAAAHFFHKNQWAAGAITTSFEMGWYFGGIQGAANGAKLYNERLYEQNAHRFMTKHKLYPIFMLKYGF